MTVFCLGRFRGNRYAMCEVIGLKFAVLACASGETSVEPNVMKASYTLIVRTTDALEIQRIARLILPPFCLLPAKLSVSMLLSAECHQSATSCAIDKSRHVVVLSCGLNVQNRIFIVR